METLRTGRLVLEPLVAAHAASMFDVLLDPAIYRYLDYAAPESLERLHETYVRLERGESPDGRELWLNWVVSPAGEPPVGYVQATVVPGASAWVAYVLGSRHWGRGYATEATGAMIAHLACAHGVPRFFATVEADNARSIRLLERLAFRPADIAEREAHVLSLGERLFIR